MRMFLVLLLSNALLAADQPPHLRVFLLAGQSNMGGGNYLAKPRDNNPPANAIWYRVSHIDQTAKPDDDKWTFLENLVPNTAHGSERMFAYRMRDQFPNDRIAIVKCYRNGAGRGLWTAPVADGMHGWAFTVARMESVRQDLDDRVKRGELSGWSWEGFVWMQGESDAAFASQPVYSRDYDKDLQRLAALVRAQTRRQDLPCVIGRIYNFANRMQLNLPEGWRQLSNVRWAQERAPLDFPPAAWVDTDSLTWRDDDAHCGDYTEMGVRFGQAMVNLMTGKAVPQRPFRPTVTWTKGGQQRLFLDQTGPKEDPWREEHEYTVVEKPGLGVTAGVGQVTLDWDHAQDAATYTVRWGTDPQRLDQSKAGIVQNQFTITGLANGTPIHAAVVAVNAQGDSLPSHVVSATPAADAQVPLWVWTFDLKRYPEARVPAMVGQAAALEATVRGPRLDQTSFRWQQIEGPAPVVIADAAAMDTTVTCPQPGKYLLRFTATEGSSTASRELEVWAEAPTPNTPPMYRVIKAADGTVGQDALLEIDIETEDLFPRLTQRRAVWRIVSGPEGATVAGVVNQRYLGVMRATKPGRYAVEASLDDGELATVVPFTVDIYPAGTANLAAGAPTRQSSETFPHLAPGVAVNRDEGPDSHFSRTKNDPTPWWEVDLGDARRIDRVMILPRTANLKQVRVQVLGKPYAPDAKPVWESEALTMTPRRFIDVPVTASGRYVAVVGQGSGSLELIEVRVIGEGQRAAVAVTKPASDDQAPPSQVQGLRAEVVGNAIQLHWKPATDNVGVHLYKVFKDGVYVEEILDPEYLLRGLATGTPYAITVIAVDAAGNLGKPSAALTVTLPKSP